MSIELILTTFEEEEMGRLDAADLTHLADSLRDTVHRRGGTAEDVQTSAEEVQVHLPGGTAMIYSDHAIFPIEELDPLTLGVVYDLAKAADMVIVTEGGDYADVVVSAAQRKRLPKEDRSPSLSPVCRGPKHLARLLDSWFRAHSEFKERAIADFAEPSTPKRRPARTPPEDPNADWNAKRPLDVVKLSDHSASGARSYRWDPWVGDVVANGPVPVPIRMHRFDSTRNEMHRHPEILRELKDVCERHRQAYGDDASKLIDDNAWLPLDFRMRFFTADVWPDRAEFNLYQLNDSIAAFMLEIARTGDMSFVPLGGVILAKPGQADRLPRSWKRTMRIVTSQTPGELKYWLRRLGVDWSADIDDGFKHLFDDGEIATGTYPVARRRHIYLECKSKETAAKQQNKLFGHESRLRPEAGMLGGEFWRLETPPGGRFHAYEYSGDWLPFIRDFAVSDHRALGSIVNFETFVQEDDQRFPLTECTVRKVDPDER